MNNEKTEAPVKAKIEKPKKLKKKTTGMDIFYRIVTILMAAAVPVAAYYAKLIYLVVKSTAFALIAQLTGDSSDNGDTQAYYSISKFVTNFGPLIKDKGTSQAGSVWASLSEVHTQIIMVAVCFVLTVLLAVAIFLTGCFSNKRLPQLIMSGVGILSMIIFAIAFSSLANTIVSGEVGLQTLFNSDIVKAFLPYLASISVLKKSSGYYLMLFLHIAIFLWTGSNMLIDLGDEKAAKAPKKVK